uniref:Complex I assembly factor TIMMDC1, mitochondrial n=1 Tax=Onchocerca volvulus TaxID=6282 RepID=A0A8R1XUX7_ONCVO
MDDKFPDTKDKIVAENEQIADNFNSSGWQRLKKLYNDKDVHFETGILMPCMNWTFIGTVLLTGPLGWQRAADRYDRYAKGRIFLSPRDALRRKWDYAFVSFLRRGAINGTLTTLYVGCMVAAITHFATWRGHFSLWSVPVITTSVPSIIACPFGLRKMMQAASLGLACGLTLSLIVFGVSYFSNLTINDTYQRFKQEHELLMRAERDKDEKVKLYQKENKIWSRNLAKILMEKDKKLKDEISEDPCE